MKVMFQDHPTALATVHSQEVRPAWGYERHESRCCAQFEDGVIMLHDNKFPTFLFERSNESVSIGYWFINNKVKNVKRNRKSMYSTYSMNVHMFAVKNHRNIYHCLSRVRHSSQAYSIIQLQSDMTLVTCNKSTKQTTPWVTKSLTDYLFYGA